VRALKYGIALLAIASPLSATSFAEDLPCPSVTLADHIEPLNDPKLPQNYYGTDHNVCYAAAAARLLEAELAKRNEIAPGQTVSYLSLALNSKADSLFLKNDLPDAGSACIVINHVSRKSICLQRSNDVDKSLTPEEVRELRRQFLAYVKSSAALEGSDWLFENAGKLETLKTKFAEKLACSDANHHLIATIDQIKSNLNFMFSNQFLGSMIDQKCDARAELPNIQCQVLMRDSTSLEGDRKLMARINEVLTSSDPKPLLVGHCSKVQGDPKSESSREAALSWTLKSVESTQPSSLGAD
jgi:hypothetical protein